MTPLADEVREIRKKAVEIASRLSILPDEVVKFASELERYIRTGEVK